MTCTWEPDTGCLGTQWDALSPEERDQALMLATSSLQALTYNRVGTCPITIRPCPQIAACACANPYLYDGQPSWMPYEWNGQWYNGCPGKHSCAPLSEIDIPGPVGYIDSLKINGAEVDLYNGDWRLDNGHLLVWQGAGISPVPSSQNLNRPDTEPGTWSLTYSRSYPVGADAKIAVAYLAMEFANACKPRGKCALPRGVSSVVRSGVSFTIDAGLFPNGLTGMDLVDPFILKWAPAGSPSRNAEVFDPRNLDGPRRISAVPRRPVPGSV